VARKPIIGCADGIFAVAPLESAYDEVRPRHLLKVVDERVVHRRAANCANKWHRLHRQLLRDNDTKPGGVAPFAGLNVNVPALYVAGDRDLVMYFPGMDRLLPNLSNFVPKLRKTIVLPGCGHWTQQEQPAEVNAAMIEFLRGL
jgi:pimeloyl-ACP methyl ester carboxylesterase